MTNFSKKALGSVCFVSLISTASALNQAEAAGTLADAEKVAVQAQANVAQAAASGDAAKTAEVIGYSEAVSVAVAQAKQAYEEMERLIGNGDEDAAQSAADDLMAALESALNALNGVISEEAVEKVEEWKEAKKNAGGGPAGPNDPPNMYDKAWNSQQVRDFYTSHFGNILGSGVVKDDDATPE